MAWIRTLTIERLTQAILFLLLFVMGIGVPLDTDLWWHLRAGEYFLDEGSILQEDIFSFSKAGERWVNHSWGGQVVMALAYRATGGDGQLDDSGVIGLALYTTLFSTAGMWVVYQMCEGNGYSKAFVMVLGATTAAVFWSPRPQMISFFFSTLALWILHQYKRKVRENAIWWLIPLMAVWVNFHAGFAIGFILLLGFMAGEAAGNLFDPQHPQRVGWRRLGKVGIVGIFALLALALNPYGLRMVAYPFDTLGLQTLNLFIQEWLSPNFKNPQTWTFILMLLSILGLASQTKSRMEWSDLSLVMGTAMLSLFAARNIAVFAIVATPILSRQVMDFLEERQWRLPPPSELTPKKVALNWLLLSIVAFGVLAQLATTLSPTNVQDVQEELLPIKALDYLQANPPQGHLFNHYNWGGLVIFTMPDTPVLVDGRTDLYGDDFLKDYFNTLLGASEWRKLFIEYDIQAAFLENESALTTLLREDEVWEVVYEDDQAAILRRKTAE